MSKSSQNPPVGFVMPSGPNQYQGHYPPQPQQQQYPYYPPQSQQHTAYPPPVYSHQPFPPPIQHQPGFFGQPQVNIGGSQWSSNTNFHQYLSGASSFHVKQKIELLEAIIGWETPNKYTVKDQLGNKLLFVGEESGCMGRQFCANYRPFDLSVKDSRGADVLRFERPLNCSCCCGLFCKDNLSVNTASGQRLGSVVEEFSILYPKFKLKDATGKTQLKIEGPLCACSLRCNPVNFKVMNREGVTVGTISKHWSGLVREFFTDADYFSISFPSDLDNAMKAVCLGALFLIDFEYFEDNDGSRFGD